ncbi:MAG: hypothetical protein SOY42_12355 [Clostridium sp.]|nr:hypothetical protein [Clostridium sp.]
MNYFLNGKNLIWNFDKNETDNKKLENNNLYIEDLWNMKDTVGYTDSCVGVSILSDNKFYFVTFMGLGFTMQICNDKVICLKKQITK